MTDMPDDWARHRARALISEEMARGVAGAAERAMARYIQSHEQPPEPDWEAWRPALEAYRETIKDVSEVRNFSDHDRLHIRGLIAASKVMPK